MSDRKEQMGRLAMRVEGDLWVAYYALPSTMKDAVFLGSIQMAFVQDWQRRAIHVDDERLRDRHHQRGSRGEA